MSEENQDAATMVAVSPAADEPYQSSKKPLEFWLVFLGTSVAVFLSALELASVGTALPTIVEELKGPGFIWVGAAYSLASSALMPASGGLSNIFGRRAVMMVAIAFFAIGTAVSGSAKTMHIMIVGRAIQGAGGGSIISMSEIIVADLVPLRERGNFAGIIGAVWALASVLGPPIGGALASAGQWRWLFCMLPGGVPGENLAGLAWFGTLLFLGGLAAFFFALLWVVFRSSWPSPLFFFLFFFVGLVLLAFLAFGFPFARFLLPLGVFFGVVPLLAAPVAIITGQSVERTGHYLIQNYLGFMVMMVGYGTLSLLTAESTTAMASGLQIVGAVGLGILYVAPNFAVLAPLAVEDNAHALALMSYIRSFGQTFGVTIGTTVLQNGLKSRLPADFIAQFPTATDISYAIIPIINSLPEPTRSLVRQAFAGSIHNIWLWVVGIAGFGLLSSMLMKQITLHTTMDENWGLQKREDGKVTPTNEEKAMETA
ncbi:MFS general substrate transporter [Clavulina sp. PMI_390]|nr:MFS general substrate transporter [Clavulina sp. PMI_390]